MLLFDGVCNLCNSSVQFVIARDPLGRVRFAALQSPAGQALLSNPDVAAKLPAELLASCASLGPDPLAGRLDSATPGSMVLVDGAAIYTRSSAALRVARYLRWPWPLLGVFWVIPRPVRDWVYRRVARNRYRWFGRRDTCWAPSADLKRRFL